MKVDDAAILTAAQHARLDALDGEADGMLERVQAWAQINSGSRNTAGLERMRAQLNTVFAPTGGHIEAVELGDSEIVRADGVVERVAHPPAFRLTQRPDAPIQVVMTGHHDTVFPADSHFQTCQFLDDDTLNGPGVADMKGGLIALATALTWFEADPNAGEVGYTVLVSPDEEIGSPASAPHLAELGKRAHFGMTYEPALADGALAGARKGSGNFSVVITGRAAHAGREHHLGRNALEAAAHLVVALQDLNGTRDAVTVNVGKIDGGGPVNVVPAGAVVRFNVRMREPEDMDWAHAQITRLVAETNARDGIEAHLHGGFTRPPKPMAPPNAALFGYVKATGAALGLTITWKDTGGVCEGNNLWASGCPNVDTLGVRGAHIHSDQEIVKVSSLVERAKLSAAMLSLVAAGHFDVRSLRARV